MKSKLILAALLIAMSIQTLGQTAKVNDVTTNLPDNLIGVGGNWSQAGSPKFDGMAVYGHLATNSTYSFTIIDLFPTKSEVQTQLTTGLMTQVLTIATRPIYTCATTGTSTTGTATGWAFNVCAASYLPFKKGSNWAVMPMARLNKSSVGTGYSAIVGAVVTWGE